MSEPRWIAKSALVLLHAEALAQHGGAEGIPDDAALESALGRPLNHFAYAGTSDLSALAAAYAVGISRNHPFVDGNKRAAFIALGLFLAMNGLRLVADQVAATRVMLAVAAGGFAEDELTAWVREHSRPR
jgi:death-on-curing protein